MKNINITSSQRIELLHFYWEIRGEILKLNGLSKNDFEFGELFTRIVGILDEIQAPTFGISHQKLSIVQQVLMRIRALIRRWVGFEGVLGSIDSLSSIIEELLSTRRPMIRVEIQTKQHLIELYSGMQVEIRKAYNHT